MSNVNDRAVEALSDIKWAVVPDEADLPYAVALVLRVIRDDIAMAWQRGQINDLDGAEDLLNERIFNLTGQQTITGETTQVEPEPTVALVSPVGENGRLLPASVVTVNGQSWPVPPQYGTVMWMHRVGRTLRDKGWSVTGEARPSTEPGVYEVPVRKIESEED